MTHIYERSGIMYSVDYDPPDETGHYTVNSVRVLGADYKPTGPDLLPAFKDLLVMESPTSLVVFLDEIAESLPA